MDWAIGKQDKTTILSRSKVLLICTMHTCALLIRMNKRMGNSQTNR